MDEAKMTPAARREQMQQQREKEIGEARECTAAARSRIEQAKKGQ